ncbi:MAG: histidinol-phosphatase HisJ [Candidatus Omnitrophica bacterium]|nr:histidinol-phosphatase HisJ [Candidatus Omnitrophota bacterium]
MHTPLCGHASGEPVEYVRQAIDVGLKEIGFSDHAPLLSHKDPGIAMDITQLPLYHKMIEGVRRQFSDKITINVGIEADYLPGFEDATRTMLSAYPYDYVIGSVHFIEKWGFDDPIQLKEWDKKDVNDVYREYFKLLRQSARAGLFDILGHVDLVKKFDFHPTEDMTDEIEANALAYKESGVVIEINSSGLHKPAGEIYPSLAHLKVYRQHNVPITFGSDAHKPVQVGRDFNKARDWAMAAGYSEYVMFMKRKVVRTVTL